MSALTEIKKHDLKDFLDAFSLHEVTQLDPIAEGTVNSNYLLGTKEEKYILCLFEYLNENEAELYLKLTDFLQQNNLAVPKPQTTTSGAYTQVIKNKPACVVSYLQGQSPQVPTVKECESIGFFLGQMHHLTKAFPNKIHNTMSHAWLAQQCQQLMPQARPEDQTVLQHALQIEQAISWQSLPKSIIHFDLFRDNAFFSDQQLQGVFDFYYACYDCMIIDLAIALNDWCTDWQSPDLYLNKAKVLAVISGYEKHRPLLPQEKSMLLPCVQLMAAHFFVTRLNSQLKPLRGQAVTMKSPEEFKQIFSNRLTLSNVLDADEWRQAI